LNKEIDSTWLGVDLSGESPFPSIAPDDSSDSVRPQPVGLGDLASALSTKKAESTRPEGEVDLRAALLKKMLESRESTDGSAMIAEPATSDASKIDQGLPPPARFLALMDELSSALGKSLPVMVMKAKAPEIELSPEEFDEVLGQLVKEGTVYMVDEDTVRRADIMTE
jgi:hypothetical protein